MTGRRATQILNGPSSRPVRAALAAVLAGAGSHAARALREELTTPASQFAACPRCGAALQFPTEHATGRLLERCDGCGFERVMPRQTPAQVEARDRARLEGLFAAEEAAEIARETEPLVQDRCVRCAAALPPRRVGVRRRKLCKDRVACRQRAKGTRPRRLASAIALEDACAQVAKQLPKTRKAARSVAQLGALLPGLTVSQLRGALRAMVRGGTAQAAWLDERRPSNGGRPPMGYWSTRP